MKTWTIRVFDVYIFSDLVKFLQLIEQSGATFISASRSSNQSGMVGGYVVVYSHWEELGMEVKT